MRVSVLIISIPLLTFMLAVSSPASPTREHRNRSSTFTATAYCQRGRTASGAMQSDGTAAADPELLAIGTTIKVTGAGAFDRTYAVRDTGRDIQGRRLDLYVASCAEAKRFGRRRVRV